MKGNALYYYYYLDLLLFIIYFRLIAVDSNDLTSEVVQVTVVLCPNCVNGFCNVDTAEEVTENLQNASCSCDRGWTGNDSILCTSMADIRHAFII